MTRCIVFAMLLLTPSIAYAADLTVELQGDTSDVTMVGAFNRWDMDGNHNKLVNGKAKISAPEVDAKATNAGDGRWVFKDLKPGTYDLVIMKGERTRLEGWHYPPVLDFDPFFPPDATTDDATREWIEKDIRGARHYENKVVPLAMGGDKKVVRILVMLIRDIGNTNGSETMRFEVWEYEFRYGGWVKQKRTKVLHRIAASPGTFRKWHWLWDADLGNVNVTSSDKTIDYKIPSLTDEKLLGLRPY